MFTVALGTLTNINLPSLTYLSLANCELQGRFPEIFINLTQLHTLDLTSNSLSGPIPSGLGGLRNLASIYLDGNLLDGTIPSELFSLPSLETISLGGNQLSGPIPSGVGVLRNLASIYLDGNLLDGTIPSGLFSLPSLGTISLAGNQLSGPIPSGLFSLPSLETIILAENQLSGPIPSSIFELVNLTELDLSSNHLSGTVELYMFAKLKNLRFLVLSRNSLSISTTIKVNSSFPKLEYSSLSSCNINEFPQILSTAENLRLLDLSDNKIHGHIPNWLPSLETIYLRDMGRGAAGREEAADQLQPLFETKEAGKGRVAYRLFAGHGGNLRYMVVQDTTTD
ncbi:hypothetical protein LWI28_028785 [Acer negundo]|uniref:Disease resistance R13L4/SHOC-2-like LRR domain-containing protein n=1 Tax=Acer negundo TaxID=4023 RepID=A0AAD5J7Y7_ACENE|nr:hypothetical protein LWI28_028785 [Acer negundo]